MRNERDPSSRREHNIAGMVEASGRLREPPRRDAHPCVAAVSQPGAIFSYKAQTTGATESSVTDLGGSLTTPSGDEAKTTTGVVCVSGLAPGTYSNDQNY